MADTITPSLSSSLENSSDLASSPMITGVIGVSLTPVLNPSLPSFSLKYLAFAQSLSVYSVVSFRILNASITEATTAGGNAVENKNGLPLCNSQSFITCLPAT